MPLFLRDVMLCLDRFSLIMLCCRRRPVEGLLLLRHLGGRDLSPHGDPHPGGVAFPIRVPFLEGRRLVLWSGLGCYLEVARDHRVRPQSLIFGVGLWLLMPFPL